MDVVLVVGLFLTLFIFEPGNKEFESRKLCWDYYTDYREDIPN